MMRYFHCAILSAIGLVVACCAITLADAPQTTQTELTPRDLHVWGRFDPGTWKRVRIITETLNEKGVVVDTTTTETKTTLVRADAGRLALRIEATVEVAGRRFDSPPQTVEYGYYGEAPSQRSETKFIGSEPLTIDGRQVQCEVRQVVATSADQKQVTRMYLSNDVEPFVLKRETTLLKTAGKSDSDQETQVEVIALDMPYRVLRDIKSAAYERTVQETPRGTNITLDVTCVDVPGGIVARTGKEMNSKGQLVRRSTLELVDYRIVDNDDDGSATITRRQARRARRH
jgi:hypothetical protein